MDPIKLSEFRAQLDAMMQDLRAVDVLGEDGQKTVELDQQSIGRLSRMDALQHQAMAKASQARRGQIRQRIALALARMEQDDYGYCTECGEDIPLKRLALDPTVPTCVGCAGG